MESRRWALVLSGLAFVLLLGFLYRGVIFPPKPPFDLWTDAPTPSLSIYDPSGKTVDLREEVAVALKTHSKVLVSLWATWCEPCLKELPEIEERRLAWEKMGLKVLLINEDGGNFASARKQAESWLQKAKIETPTHYDQSDRLVEKLGVVALPFSFVVNSENKIEWLSMGSLNVKKLESSNFQHPN